MAVAGMSSNLAFWDGRYAEHGRIYGKDPSVLARWTVNSRLLKPGGRIIEVGCGTGRNSIFFAKHGLEAAGMDFSAVALEMAKEDAGREGVDVAFVTGDMTALGNVFKEPAFDAAFCNFCLHLFDETTGTAIVEGMRGLLVPDGIIVASLLSTADDGFGVGKCLGPCTYETMPGKPHHFFTKAAVEALFGSFRILHLEQTHEFELIVSDTHETMFWRLVAREGG